MGGQLQIDGTDMVAAAGTAVCFEPDRQRDANLAAHTGKRTVHGSNQKAKGKH